MGGRPQGVRRLLRPKGARGAHEDPRKRVKCEDKKRLRDSNSTQPSTNLLYLTCPNEIIM